MARLTPWLAYLAAPLANAALIAALAAGTPAVLTDPGDSGWRALVLLLALLPTALGFAALGATRPHLNLVTVATRYAPAVLRAAQIRAPALLLAAGYTAGALVCLDLNWLGGLDQDTRHATIGVYGLAYLIAVAVTLSEVIAERTPRVPLPQQG